MMGLLQVNAPVAAGNDKETAPLPVAVRLLHSHYFFLNLRQLSCRYFFA
jgi:hypothetical protein